MGALTRFFGRAIGLGTDSSPFWRAFFGADTDAGEPVTVDVAMQLSTVWACVRLLSETIGTLPIGLYRRADDGGRSLATDHALYSILHDSPNADHTAAEFWEGAVACLCLWGNAYAELAWSTRRLSAMTLLRPDMMQVNRDDNGELLYTYRYQGDVRVYRQSEILHIRGFGVGQDLGLSPIAFARQSVAAARATEKSAAKLFSNGLQTAGLLTSEQTLKPEQRAQLQEIMSKYAGSDNARKLMILEAGLKFESVTMNPEDAQMLQTRAFQVEEICRWFRVPPFMVGSTEKSTSWGTGIEQQMIGFLTFSLRPYLTRIEQSIKRQLLSAPDRLAIYAEFNLEGLLRADSQARAQLYASFAQNGIMDRDEIRTRENLSRRGGNAAELTVQSNMLPIDKLGIAATLPAEKPLKSALLNHNGRLALDDDDLDLIHACLLAVKSKKAGRS